MYVRAEMEFRGIVYILCPICLKFAVEHLCAVSVSSCNFPSKSAQGSSYFFLGVKGNKFRRVP
jgi:hypothetical protein